MTDFGFKKIFGDKEVMTAFLTDLLEPKTPIVDLTFINKELPPETQYEHGVIYDLHCKTQDGSQFIVEMQNKSQLHFSDRILFYLSRSLSSQEKNSDNKWNYALTPVYGVFFLNFHLRGFKPMALRTIQLKVNETGEIFSEKLKAFTLELPDFAGRKEEDCKTMMDYWMYNLVNLETMKSTIPFQAQQPVFGKVANISELINMTPEERVRYNISLDSFRTNLSVLQNERAEGLLEGEAKGMAKERLAIAKSLKSMGLSPSQIASATGLTIDDIANLS